MWFDTDSMSINVTHLNDWTSLDSRWKLPNENFSNQFKIIKICFSTNHLFCNLSYLQQPPVVFILKKSSCVLAGAKAWQLLWRVLTLSWPISPIQTSVVRHILALFLSWNLLTESGILHWGQTVPWLRQSELQSVPAWLVRDRECSEG